MRLTEKAQRAIKESFAAIQGAHHLTGKLYLFGSRTQDKRKGGDIDLLWLVPMAELARAQDLKLDLISKILLHIGEQRIDLTVLAQAEAPSNPFYQSIQDSLIFLA